MKWVYRKNWNAFLDYMDVLSYAMYTHRHHRFKYWHGIWTIVLLLYVMSVETSTSLLFCPTLNVNDCPEVERVSVHSMHTYGYIAQSVVHGHLYTLQCYCTVKY